ncbi:MAG: glycosyltransferase [Gracilimonas sp.]
MSQAKPHISVIIVNYKVKEYIANLLNSLKKGQSKFNLEIFVVDNASGDDAVSYLKKRFPSVNYIENENNLGFGKANNQAISKASGEYTLIINPDTLVSEDTLEVMLSHMQENPKCGAAGCKILNPDGTFAPESKRSIPTMWSAFSKVFGLNNLFSKSKIFGGYYLRWIDMDEVSKVPVLSGSFMFWRTELLKKLNGFDERFFMYGEDIDLCYRIQKTKYHIDYVPKTSIIHYKGESSKKGDLQHIRIFNKALYQFFDKHYSSRYSLFFRVLIYLAIWIKTFGSLFSSNIKKVKSVVADLLLLNLSIAVGFVVRYAFLGENIINPEGTKYLWVNVLGSCTYLFSGSLFGLYKQNKESISRTLKTLSATYAGVVIITFFVRDLAYTRLGLILGFVFGVIFFISYKLFKINYSGKEHQRGKVKKARIVIVGDADYSSDIISKIYSRPDWNYEIVGYITVNNGIEDKESLGRLAHLKDLIKAYHVDQVFFALNSISYKQMLVEISALQNEDLVFKLIPDSMDFILGKSNVEYMEAIPLVEVEFKYSHTLNKLLKRLFDLAISIPLFLLIFLATWPSLLFSKKESVTIGEVQFYTPVSKHSWKNRLRLLVDVITGKLSLVGAPIYDTDTEHIAKRGITGLIQISDHKIQTKSEAENFALYYLQNYSIWMDIDIILKTLFNKPYPLELIQDFEQKTS